MTQRPQVVGNSAFNGAFMFMTTVQARTDIDSYGDDLTVHYNQREAKLEFLRSL